MLNDGRRQIFGILLPGDSVGLRAEPPPATQATVVALIRLDTCDPTLLRAVLMAGDPEHAGLTQALAGALLEPELLEIAAPIARRLVT